MESSGNKRRFHPASNINSWLSKV